MKDDLGFRTYLVHIGDERVRTNVMVKMEAVADSERTHRTRVGDGIMVLTAPVVAGARTLGVLLKACGSLAASKVVRIQLLGAGPPYTFSKKIEYQFDGYRLPTLDLDNRLGWGEDDILFETVTLYGVTYLGEQDT